MPGVFVSGRYAYVASYTAKKLTIIDLQGSDLSSLSVGSVSAGSLQVADSLDVGNSVNVRGALNVGPGGIYSQGSLSVFDTNSNDANAIFVVGRDGNVGVGTAFPANKLNVRGDVNITTLTSNGIVYSNNGVLTNTDPSSLEYKNGH